MSSERKKYPQRARTNIGNESGERNEAFDDIEYLHAEIERISKKPYWKRKNQLTIELNAALLEIEAAKRHIAHIYLEIAGTLQ